MEFNDFLYGLMDMVDDFVETGNRSFHDFLMGLQTMLHSHDENNQKAEKVVDDPDDVGGTVEEEAGVKPLKYRENS